MREEQLLPAPSEVRCWPQAYCMYADGFHDNQYQETGHVLHEHAMSNIVSVTEHWNTATNF